MFKSNTSGPWPFEPAQLDGTVVRLLNQITQGRLNSAIDDLIGDGFPVAARDFIHGEEARR